MANGDLARALAYQSNLQSDTRALFRQWMNNVTQSNERDKQRLYESTIRDEDRKISEGIREDSKKQSLSEWNRNETRYQDSVRRQNDSESRDQDAGLINQGSEISNLQGQKDYFRQLINAGGLKSINGLDMAESKVNFLTGRISDANKNIGTLNDIGMEKYYVDQASNFYMQGNDAAAFNIVDSHFKNKFKDPQTLAEAQLLMTNIKADNAFLGKLAGAVGEGVDTEKLRLQNSIKANTKAFRELYQLKTPFDSDALLSSFQTNAQTRLKNAGFDISDKEVLQRLLGETGDYSEEIQAWENKYILNEDASTHSAEKANKDAVKIINNIIAKEKNILPPITETGEWEDMVPTAGQVGAGYLGWQLAKEPVKKAAKVIGDKAVAAGKHIQFVTKLPGQDIVKFLDEVAMNTPGRAGTMMPKVEKILDQINDLSGDKKTKLNIAKMAKLNKELDDQIDKVKRNLRKRGVSTKMKDADIEKLLRDPNKWRLAGVKKHMINLRPRAAKVVRGWGVYSAARRIGEALGDPTGGVATGLGAASAVKGIKSLVKKKGKKWTYKKLAPIVGKTLAKRVATGAIAGLATGPGAVATTIGGAVLGIWDLYDILFKGEEPAEGKSVSRVAAQSDSTQAQIDSAQMRKEYPNYFEEAIK